MDSIRAICDSLQILLLARSLVIVTKIATDDISEIYGLILMQTY